MNLLTLFIQAGIFIFAVVVLIGAIVVLGAEATDKVESLKGMPIVGRYMSSRQAFMPLFLLCLFLLLGDGYESMTKEVPEVPPPPTVQIKPPPAPIMMVNGSTTINNNTYPPSTDDLQGLPDYFIVESAKSFGSRMFDLFLKWNSDIARVDTRYRDKHDPRLDISADERKKALDELTAEKNRIQYEYQKNMYGTLFNANLLRQIILRKTGRFDLTAGDKDKDEKQEQVFSNALKDRSLTTFNGEKAGSYLIMLSERLAPSE